MAVFAAVVPARNATAVGCAAARQLCYAFKDSTVHVEASC